MKIEFKRLSEVSIPTLHALMNHPLVRKQMPLLHENFSEKDCQNFVSAKEQIWKSNGFGPWAFYIEEQFAGWGGLQPEEGEIDLALVLHPDFWGIGKEIYKKLIHEAFEQKKIDSVIILFPSSRSRINGILRLGFVEDGSMKVSGQQFNRYRLRRI